MDKLVDLFVDKSRHIDKTRLWMRAKTFIDKSKDPLIRPIYG